MQSDTSLWVQRVMAPANRPPRGASEIRSLECPQQPFLRRLPDNGDALLLLVWYS